MKTVIDVVNEFKGEWPYRNSHSIVEKLVDSQLFKKGELSNYEGSMRELTGNWLYVCSKEEFNRCVREMSEPKWINPIFTQAMADNNELPSVGMEFMWSQWASEELVKAKMIAKNDDECWIEYNENSTIVGNITGCKPIPEPIELIDGKAYQLDYDTGSTGMNDAVMRYRKSGDYFYFDNHIFKREYCKNIVLLTPEVKS